jgi:hypothetical protein
MVRSEGYPGIISVDHLGHPSWLIVGSIAFPQQGQAGMPLIQSIKRDG